MLQPLYPHWRKGVPFPNLSPPPSQPDLRHVCVLATTWLSCTMKSHTRLFKSSPHSRESDSL